MVCLYLTYGIRSDPHSSSKNSPCTLIHHWSPKVTRPTPASTLNFQTRVHSKTRVLKNINNSRETLKLETRLDLNRRTSLNKKNTHTLQSGLLFFGSPSKLVKESLLQLRLHVFVVGNWELPGQKDYGCVLYATMYTLVLVCSLKGNFPPWLGLLGGIRLLSNIV